MKGATNKIKEELDNLVKEGFELAISKEKKFSKFKGGYQKWYTRSLAVVRHLLPDRLAEFERLYHQDKRKDISISTYTIEDYLNGIMLKFHDEKELDSFVLTKFGNQILILESATSRLDDILANIQGVLQADLFDSEIDAAKHLKKKGHLRAAGVVASVVLESHLSQVCQNHRITIRKKKPSIGDFNDALKDNIYDTTDWRWIQRLGDIRKLCVHKKEREPTPEEVQELIDGVGKVIKTIA